MSLLVLGSLCMALAYLLYFALVAEVGAVRGTVVTYVNPPIAVFLGITLLGEPLTTAIMVSFLLIIVGSWLSIGGALKYAWLNEYLFVIECERHPTTMKIRGFQVL